MTRSSSKHSISDASVLPVWRKSSYSGGSSGECLEVSDAFAACVPVRDSKVPHGSALLFAAPVWTPFITAVKSDGFNR
ncbi:hypothetical protein SSPS47_14060 [Streptomyces sp. S4.7]|uniref:DUF397 domain-containing protein n=1 Tax=Streptomyces sp. S4.7 TaxID=2705439 RepID=UPI0013996B0F|nr:DUF397 domain-containing protein [Streptomyces sp. S4.7]QHY96237.1 hypothetical protein SSPS47_14060 [Streptomyces sp. S4.7]